MKLESVKYEPSMLQSFLRARQQGVRTRKFFPRTFRMVILHRQPKLVLKRNDILNLVQRDKQKITARQAISDRAIRKKRQSEKQKGDKKEA